VPTAEHASPTGPAARPLEDSIDEESINVLNARISDAGRVTLDEASPPSASLLASSDDDSSLAASFNQRLKELSGEEQAYDEPLTGVLQRMHACLTGAHASCIMYAC
jgi:hypothetical protein